MQDGAYYISSKFSFTVVADVKSATFMETGKLTIFPSFGKHHHRKVWRNPDWHTHLTAHHSHKKREDRLCQRVTRRLIKGPTWQHGGGGSEVQKHLDLFHPFTPEVFRKDELEKDSNLIQIHAFLPENTLVCTYGCLKVSYVHLIFQIHELQKRSF